MMWVGRDQSPYGLGGLLVAAVLITALVLLRQFTTSRENLQLAERFEQLATTDALSGLSNRRHLFDVAADYLLAATSRNQPLSALIMDVDPSNRSTTSSGTLPATP
jgi:predicted signal transduction protein with EAL and GGDEF domain